MISQQETGPQYRAKGGAKISGDPVQGMRSQGALGGAATCEHSQELSPGLLMNAKEHQMDADPQTKPTNFSYESTCRLLLSTPTTVI